MGSSKSVTIGYKYYIGMHMGLCHGPIDYVHRIFVDERVAWEGESTGGAITIDADELFGGDKKEGGVSGTVDLEFGASTQPVNGYLSSQLGADTPAFRGVMCAVLNQTYVGNNPYLKPWAFELSRIHVLEDGSTQWYDAKAEIPSYSYTGVAYSVPTSVTLDSMTNVAPYHDGNDPAPVNAVVLTGFDADLTYEINFTAGGWTYDTLTPPTLYYTDFDVTGEGGVGHTHQHFFTGSPGFTTAAAALSYRQSQPKVTLTGNTSYAFWIYDTVLNNSGSVTFNVGQAATAFDMNPAHIIRESLTESWGLGHPTSDIDDAAFTAAADTLYSEGMGISILWDKEIPLEDFIAQIKQHINAELYVSRTTGKFVLKLIRDDYEVDSSILVLDETNAQMAQKASRPSIGELVTSVTVQYTDAMAADEQGSVTVHNEALIQMQGIDRNATAQYIGFSNRTIATRVALRDLKTLSTPLLTAEVIANRQAATLNIGDVFVLDFPEQGISQLVMRVQAMSVGDGLDNSVAIRCIEDVFSTPPANIVIDDGPAWEDPSTIPALPASPRVVTETPYYQLVQDSGQVIVDALLTDDPDAGYLAAFAGRQGGELNAALLVDSGAGYEDTGVLDFAPYTTLAEDAWYSDSVLYYTGGKDMDIPTAGDLAQIGEEIVRFDGFGTDSTGTYLSVGRGVLDTAPAEHTAGASILFLDIASDTVRYTASDSIDVVIRTTLGAGTSSSEPVDTVVMDSRAVRPYPPGQLRIDGASYPQTFGAYSDVNILDWAHRDRTQQTSGTIFDYSDGDIGPEAGTTYLVTADAILPGPTISADFLSENVGSATSYNHSASAGSPAGSALSVRYKVYSVRDGYQSWQPAMVVVPVGGSGFWTPANTTTALWLDAADTPTIVGSPGVSQWQDKSGNARHFSQATSGLRPQTGITSLGGNNVLDFDADYLTSDSAASVWKFMHDSTDCSVFIVFTPGLVSNPAVYYGILGTYSNSVSNRGFSLAIDDRVSTPRNNSLEHVVANGGGGGGINIGHDADGMLTMQSPVIVGVLSDPNNATEGSRATFYRDGVVVADTPFLGSYSATVSSSDPTYTLCVGSLGNGFSPIKGSIAEIVIVSGIVSTNTRLQFEGYFAHKWFGAGAANTLASGHIYKNNPPLFNST